MIDHSSNSAAKSKGKATSSAEDLRRGSGSHMDTLNMLASKKVWES